MKKNILLIGTFKCLVVFTSCIILFMSSITCAATFTINSLDDSVDANHGDGVCADNSGNCTIRAAIQECNKLAGPDIINLPANTYNLNIEGKDEDNSATGDLDIIDDLTILGADAGNTIINGNKKDRVLHIIDSIKVEISKVQIINGLAAFGGGLLNEDATINLNDSIISRNNADSEGGGLYNAGTILISDSIISGNFAVLNGGAGIVNLGTATLDDSIISQNRTHNGPGGIDNHGDITISNSTLSKNVTEIAAGGINNFGSAVISKSTISGNSASDGGGVNNSGILRISNSTVSGNSANQGGGIRNLFRGSIKIINSTIVENKAASTGGGVLYSDNNSVGKLEVLNTIIARNNASVGADCFGGLTSLGHNLISDISDCDYVPLQSDIVNMDPGLEEFNDNGQPGNGHFPLLFDSPAVDAGSYDISLEKDQIGNVRFFEGNDDGIGDSDIGAIEFIKQTTIISGRAVANEGNIAEEDITTGMPGVVETLNTAGSDLELTSDSDEGKHQMIGIRFPDMDIPENSTILSASIEFTCDEEQSSAVTITFKGESRGNAPLFHGIDGNVSNRQTTIASVDWASDDWEKGETHKCLNLESIVQEIVNNNGWVPGNSIAFIASSDDYPNHRTVENDSSSGPILTVTFQPNISTIVSDRAVASEGNIAEEEISFSASGVVETLNTAGSDLELTSDSMEDKHQMIGIRFPDMDIRKDATILGAFIDFVSDEDQRGSVTVTFKGESSDNAPLFQEIDGDVSNRLTTNASVDWIPDDWKIGEIHKSLNLKSIVQEIVSRNGWVSGNAMSFIASSDDYPNHRTAANDSVNGPTLRVTVQPDSTIVSSRAVASEGNIAEENITSGAPGVVETLNSAGSDLELSSDSMEDKRQIIGIRFPDMDIPKNSTILGAFIDFVSDEDKSGPVIVTFKGESSDNAPLFQEIDGDVSNRLTTNASVDWIPDDWKIGEKHKSSNLKSIVQEVVNHDGWVPGNAISFIASSDDYPNHRTAENGSTNGPTLTVIFQPSVQ